MDEEEKITMGKYFVSCY